MSNMDRRFVEDRAMRDAAKRNLMADIAHTRAGLSGSGVASRIFGRIGEGAKDVFETAKSQADDNRGIVAALIGALVLWFGRDRLMDLFGSTGDEEGENAERFDPGGLDDDRPARPKAANTHFHEDDLPGENDDY